MGNRPSKKAPNHRRIYIGNVPEIEEEESEETEKTSGRTTPGQNRQDFGVETGTVTEDDNRQKEIPSRPPSVKSPPVIGVTRRNSITSSPKWFQKQKQHQEFPTNEIKSSRYTILTFIPRNLFEQFRRIVNFYFLCMAIIQTVTDSPVSPVTSGAPLVFVILVTATKQGYEDWIRHRADNAVNNRPVSIVVNGDKRRIKSKELKVGNIIRLEGEEQVPSDILVIGSSDEFLRCQITTANLDGETNLKMRYCPAALPRIKDDEVFPDLKLIVECEQPNSDLYSFHGSLLVPADKMLEARGSVISGNVMFTPNIEQLRKLSMGGTIEYSGPDSPPDSGILDGSYSLGGPGTSVDGSPPDIFMSTSENNLSTDASHFYQIPLTMDNIVLRGTKVKNTDYIYGLVIYTGQDTRLAQNSKKTYTKFSTVEKTVNRFLMTFISVLFLTVIVCTVIHFFWLQLDSINPKNAWYLSPEQLVDANYIFQIFAGFIILFNYIIPISLYVTIEMQKFIGSKFFVWDEDLCIPESGNAPLCNTSDLNEELGQIEYLFSDKTGTLTENVMEFRYCSVNGKRYDLGEDNTLYHRDDEKGINEKVDINELPDVIKFFRVLTLCHTVQLMPRRRPSYESNNIPYVLGKTKLNSKIRTANSLFDLETKEKPKVGPGPEGKFEYQASSPDEKALLEACFKMGIVYWGELEGCLTVDVLGTKETYKRHYILEFDADRKCMSVIVEDTKSGTYWLLTKGAESTILPRGDSGPGTQTMKHVIDFAMMGMRTLVIAEKQLTKQEFEAFANQLRKSRRLLKHREEKMREVYRSVESHLHILGATGVEDQLQEGVPETLTALNAAGIKIWMLTGDKLETAVNVAVSCGLITPASKQILVTNYNDEDLLRHRMNEINSEMIPEDNTTFVIDGQSLQLALLICYTTFRDIAMQATRVVCCRMTPLQKAKVVSMVKQTDKHPITAAVGDGANDVAMILEAHIGLAILGKEGRQAARSADFAVARFSFLAKTILVHGHWYYVRLSVLCVYFFYKNVVFILPQVYYCFHSAFSTQSLYDAYFLTLFNLFFASCPIFIFGLQEQTYSAETLLKYPHLYKEISRNKLLTWKQFLLWNGLAFWHSIIVYFIPLYSWPFMENIMDWSTFGTTVFSGVFAVTNLKLLLEMKFMSWLTAFSFFCSFGSYFVFTTIYSETDLQSVGFDSHAFHHTFFSVMGTIGFWLVMFLVTIMCLFPDFCLRAILNSWPTITRFWNQMKEERRNGRKHLCPFTSRTDDIDVQIQNKIQVSADTDTIKKVFKDSNSSEEPIHDLNQELSNRPKETSPMSSSLIQPNSSRWFSLPIQPNSPVMSSSSIQPNSSMISSLSIQPNSPVMSSSSIHPNSSGSIQLSSSPMSLGSIHSSSQLIPTFKEDDEIERIGSGIVQNLTSPVVSEDSITKSDERLSFPPSSGELEVLSVSKVDNLSPTNSRTGSKRQIIRKSV